MVKSICLISATCKLQVKKIFSSMDWTTNWVFYLWYPLVFLELFEQFFIQHCKIYDSEKIISVYRANTGTLFPLTNYLFHSNRIIILTSLSNVFYPYMWNVHVATYEIEFRTFSRLLFVAPFASIHFHRYEYSVTCVQRPEKLTIFGNFLKHY